MNNIPDDLQIPIACTPSAMGDNWEHHKTIVFRWRDAIEETVELENGYAYRLPADLLMTVAEFVSRERLCCPFFTFQIELTPHNTLWLRLTGPEGTKELIATLQDELAK